MKSLRYVPADSVLLGYDALSLEIVLDVSKEFIAFFGNDRAFPEEFF
jgi:hypothetical protein